MPKKLIKAYKEIIRKAQIAWHESFMDMRNKQAIHIVEFPINSYVIVE